MPGPDWELDPDMAAELLTMSDQRLCQLAADIVEDLLSPRGNSLHIGAMNAVMEEAARWRVHRAGGAK